MRTESGKMPVKGNKRLVKCVERGRRLEVMGIKVHMVTEKKCWNEYNFNLMEWYVIEGKMKISKLPVSRFH